MSSKLGKIAKNFIPPITGEHHCQFPEVTRQILAMNYAYQKLFVLIETRLNRLEEIIHKDLGYSEEELSKMFDDDAVDKATAELKKIINEFAEAKSTEKSVKDTMKAWNFPVDKWK